MSLVAQKIGQTFRDSIKKKSLSFSNGSGVIHFFKEALQLRFFCEKEDIRQKRRQDKC
jgi:hypothetical protein